MASIRFVAAAGLAALLALAAPALAEALSTSGEPLVVWSDRGDSSGAGDDTLHVEQGVRRVEVVANPDGDGVFPSELDGVRLKAHLAAPVKHPVFALVREANRGVLAPAGVASVEASEQGLDVGWDVNGARRDPSNYGDLPYPSPETWGLPARVDDEAVVVEPGWVASTDRLLEVVDEGQRFCVFVDQSQTRRSLSQAGDPCRSVPGSDEARGALPNVEVATQLDQVEVALEPLRIAAAGADVAPPREADPPGEASAHGGALAPSDEGYALAIDAALPPDAPLASTGASAPAPRSPAEPGEPAPLTVGSGWLPVLVMVGVGLLLLGIPLYRRIVRGQLLDNGARSRILGLIEASPGVHESAIARDLGLGHTLVQYHVRMLAEFGLVEVRRFGGRKCLFAAGQVGRDEKTLLLAEHGRGAQVVDLLAAQPGIAQKDLARALGIRESSAKWHLDRLEAHGVVLVERGPEGKRARLSPAAEQARSRAVRVAAEPRPEPVGPPSPADPREPSPLHAAA